METLNLSFLGPLTVTRGGNPAPDFVSRKAQALLAYLVLEAARAHSREELVALLWPDYPEESARASLRSVLANMRHVIGDRDADPPHLLITRESVQFDLASDCAVDVAQLDAPPDLSPDLLAGQADARSADVVAQLEATLVRAAAPLLAGFSLPDSPPFEEWLLLRREAYARRVVALWGALARYHEQRGDQAASLASARRWEERDPWDEDAHRQIMRLLALQGHRGQAIAQFERCREVLARELGVEPSDATVELAEQIRLGRVTAPVASPVTSPAADIANAATSAQVPSPPARTPHQVPRLLTPTVGRTQELTVLAELLDGHDRRLVTIVGPGGMGKTHLALEFATRHERRYPDGAAMVPLAGLQSVDGLAAAVADALRLDLSDHQPVDEQVQSYLAVRHMLLVLDNCEHLPDVGPVVESWLESAPHLVVLATSRLRLHVRGEQLFPLGGLLVPPAEDPARTDDIDNTDAPGTEAVDFFLQCAQRVRPRRRLTGDRPDMVHVRTICRMLDGMPLALLLAASWTESLTLPEIVRELGRGLDLLQVEDRAVPVRHQKITTVFAQAWSLLSADEQRVLARLSVFRGGCTREAATTVTGATLVQLRGLTTKFLLSHQPGGRGVEQGHFVMHELLRQYAASRLDAEAGAVAQTRRAHADYFLGFLAERGPWLKGPRQMDALADIDADIDNITAAWGWACAADVMALPVEAVDALGRFYAMRARQQEGEHAMQRALDHVAANGGSPLAVNHAHLLATLYTWLAHFAGDLGHADVAAHALAQGHAALDAAQAGAGEFAKALTAARAVLLLEQGRQAQNQVARAEYAAEAVRMLRTVDRPWLLAGALLQYGKNIENAVGSPETRSDLYAESRRLYEQLGDRVNLSEVATTISFDAALRGDLALAMEMAYRAVAIATELASPARISVGQWVLAMVLNISGRFPEALPLAEAVLAVARRQGSKREHVVAYTTAADVLNNLGRFAEAEAFAECAWLAAKENQWHAGYVLWFRAEAKLALRQVDAAADHFAESIALHQHLHDTGRIYEILVRAGFAAFAQGKRVQVREWLAECVVVCLAEQRWREATDLIALAALAALMDARPARAVELYALAETFPHIANSAFFDEVAGRHVRAADATLAPDVADAARQRGAALDLWATVEALAREYTDALPPDTSGSP